MKTIIILFSFIAGLAYGTAYLRSSNLMPRTPMNIRTKSDLETPLLGSPSSRPKPEGSTGKVTVTSGPNDKATTFVREGRVLVQPSEYKDVPRGKTAVRESSHPLKNVVGGWPHIGGQVHTETTAKRVKIKMRPGQGVGSINRLNKDGTWTRETHSNKGEFTKWYKNEDDSRVTVKASLMGSRGTGALKSTGKEYDQPKKKRKWS